MYGRDLIKLSLLYFVVTQNIKNVFKSVYDELPSNQLSCLRDECLLPRHPSFGRWSMPNNKSRLISTVVPEYTILRIECDQSYILEGCSVVACLNGSWTPNIGQCSKICPPIHSTVIMKVKCKANDEETNCTDAVNGTIAYFNCAFIHENLGIVTPAICINGSWNRKIPDCRPVCGKVLTRREPTLIVGGRVAKQGQFPWQVALYHKNQSFFCGGSLLNKRLILTAAHCITDVNNGKILPKEYYLVAVGKHYQKFDDPRDLKYSQTSTIQDIYVPDEYQGLHQNYMADIALIVTVKTFKFSERVQSVCIDWNRTYENDILNSDQSKMGFVSGWGYTQENSDLSNVLTQLKVPAIPNKKCKKELPEESQEYLTYDKFCAGYLKNGSSVCSGDSGAGLVFECKGRFYIAGVANMFIPNDPIKEGCNSNHYGLYTVVYNYINNFILSKWDPPEPSIDDDSKYESCTTATSPLDAAIMFLLLGSFFFRFNGF